MVRITGEHYEASRLRASGLTYPEIAQEMGYTPEQARRWIEEYSRICWLQLSAEQETKNGEDVGG